MAQCRALTMPPFATELVRRIRAIPILDFNTGTMVQGIIHAHDQFPSALMGPPLVPKSGGNGAAIAPHVAAMFAFSRLAVEQHVPHEVQQLESARGTLDLRAQYLNHDIDRDKLSQLLVNRDRKRMRLERIVAVWEIFRASVLEFCWGIANADEHTAPVQFLDLCIGEVAKFEALCLYCNRAWFEISVEYACSVPSISSTQLLSSRKKKEREEEGGDDDLASMLHWHRRNTPPGWRMVKRSLHTLVTEKKRKKKQKTKKRRAEEEEEEEEGGCGKHVLFEGRRKYFAPETPDAEVAEAVARLVLVGQ